MCQSEVGYKFIKCKPVRYEQGQMLVVASCSTKAKPTNKRSRSGKEKRKKKKLEAEHSHIDEIE